MKIEVVSNPEQSRLDSLDVFSWPIWEKEASQFPWTYDSQEVCYILQGKVTVKTEWESVTIGAGDLVTFPSGLDCEWIIHEDIRKHYRFQ